MTSCCGCKLHASSDLGPSGRLDLFLHLLQQLQESLLAPALPGRRGRAAADALVIGQRSMAGMGGCEQQSGMCTRPRLTRRQDVMPSVVPY